MAISGSTIQNSVRCRRVLDLARNVGPNSRPPRPAAPLGRYKAGRIWWSRLLPFEIVAFQGVVVPPHAAGVKMGASQRVKPSLSRKSRTALTTVWRILRIAFCRRERSRKCLWSVRIRAVLFGSDLIVMHVLDDCGFDTSTVTARGSESSRTFPRTMIADSCPTPFRASQTSVEWRSSGLRIARCRFRRAIAETESRRSAHVIKPTLDCDLHRRACKLIHMFADTCSQ